MNEIDGKVQWAAVEIYKREFNKSLVLYAPTYRKMGGVPRNIVVKAVQERQQANRDELERRVEGDVVASLTRPYLAGFLSETCIKAFRPTLPVVDEPWKEGELFA